MRTLPNAPTSRRTPDMLKTETGSGSTQAPDGKAPGELQALCENTGALAHTRRAIGVRSKQ
eukprot:6011894-Lingulodinium_polyedra.AAC.1